MLYSDLLRPWSDAMLRRILSFLRRHATTLIVTATLGCAGPLDPTTRPVIPTGAGLGAGSFVSSGVAADTLRPASQAGFYPLRVGNRWDYLDGVTVTLIPDSGEPPTVELYQSFTRREIVGAQELNGREYMIESETVGGPGPYAYAAYYRQDASGLYQFEALRGAPGAGAAASGARQARISSRIDAMIERLLEGRSPTERDAYLLAARRLDERIGMIRALGATGAPPVAGRGFPGTAGPTEVSLLRYPLAPKSRWAVREWFPFPLTAEVVEAEQVRLPPPLGELLGYRIRHSSEVFGPDDSVQLWYGPSGFLQLVAHIETAATDPGGNLIGRWVVEQTRILTDLRLVGSEVVALPPWFQVPRK